jgi:hypothetical protein
MRSQTTLRSCGILALLAALSPGCLILSTLTVPSAGAAQEPKEPEGILVPAPKPIDQAELAGLAPGTRAEVLTLERAYALALVKARSPKQPRAATLDLKALDEQAAHLGVANFAHFRDDFLSSMETLARRPETSFHDPADAFLGTLEHQMAAENAWSRLQALEQLVAVAKQLLLGEREGMDVAYYRITAELEQARRADATARRHYRDRLDALKVDLGLAPHAPVVMDANALAPLRKTFADIEAWKRDPRRDQ